VGNRRAGRVCRLGENQLAGSLGVEHSKNTDDFESGGLSLTGSLNASYQINELWSWRVAIQSGVVPSPIQTNYMINNWSASSILSRKLTIGSLGFGMDYNHSIYDRVGPASTTPQNEDTLGFLLSYQRTFFLDRVDSTPLSIIRLTTERANGRSSN
jgi:hypothetical protein